MTRANYLQRNLLLPAFVLTAASVGLTALCVSATAAEPIGETPVDDAANERPIALPSAGTPAPSVDKPAPLRADDRSPNAPRDGTTERLNAEDIVNPPSPATPPTTNDIAVPPRVDVVEDDATTAASDLRAGGTRIASMFIPNVDYERTYVHNVGRVTTVGRRGQTHKIDDRIRDEFRVRFRLGEFPEDPDRITVTVLLADRQVGAHAAAPNPALPRKGVVLHCWQQDVTVVCKDTRSESLVNWPQWAQLDLSPWITSASVHTGSRWRRTFPTAVIAGWPDGDTRMARAAFEVVRSDTAADSSTTLSGTLDTEGTMTVLGEERRFSASATLNANYDHSAQQLDLVDIIWRGELIADGAISGEAYRWHRQTHTRLTITTTGRAER